MQVVAADAALQQPARHTGSEMAAEEVKRAPRGAMRKEMKDEQHLNRADWNVGPGPMQRAGEAGSQPSAGSRATG